MFNEALWNFRRVESDGVGWLEDQLFFCLGDLVASAPPLGGSFASEESEEEYPAYDL